MKNLKESEVYKVISVGDDDSSFWKSPTGVICLKDIADYGVKASNEFKSPYELGIATRRRNYVSYTGILYIFHNRL